MSYCWCIVHKLTNHIYQISFLNLFKSLERMLPNTKATNLIDQITCQYVGHAIIVKIGQVTSKSNSQVINEYVALATRQDISLTTSTQVNQFSGEYISQAVITVKIMAKPLANRLSKPLVMLLAKLWAKTEEAFLRKDVLKTCSKFTWEHPCPSMISMKLLNKLLKSHFGVGTFLQTSCIFSGHLFLRKPLKGCFCKEVDQVTSDLWWR